jgi:hypothetical protein
MAASGDSLSRMTTHTSDAIASADACLRSASLPTYTDVLHSRFELLEALWKIANGKVDAAAAVARAAIAKVV